MHQYINSTDNLCNSGESEEEITIKIEPRIVIDKIMNIDTTFHFTVIPFALLIIQY